MDRATDRRNEKELPRNAREEAGGGRLAKQLLNLELRLQLPMSRRRRRAAARKSRGAY